MSEMSSGDSQYVFMSQKRNTYTFPEIRMPKICFAASQWILSLSLALSILTCSERERQK